jgi:hypothetical protein
MSRGGLMLRALDAHRELAYVPVRGAIRRGAGRPNYLLGRHDSDLSWGYRGLNGNSLWMAVAASAAWPKATLS